MSFVIHGRKYSMEYLRALFLVGYYLTYANYADDNTLYSKGHGIYKQHQILHKNNLLTIT